MFTGCTASCWLNYSVSIYFFTKDGDKAAESASYLFKLFLHLYNLGSYKTQKRTEWNENNSDPLSSQWLIGRRLYISANLEKGFSTLPIPILYWIINRFCQFIMGVKPTSGMWEKAFCKHSQKPSISTHRKLLLKPQNSVWYWHSFISIIVSCTY